MTKKNLVPSKNGVLAPVTNLTNTAVAWFDDQKSDTQAIVVAGVAVGGTILGTFLGPLSLILWPASAYAAYKLAKRI
jgi:hypothetical protein